MKLRKTVNVMALTLAAIMLFAGCSSKKEDSKKEDTAETSETTAAAEDDDESDLGYLDEDLEAGSMPDSDCYDVAGELPDQNIEIDENYYAFYDYSGLEGDAAYDFEPQKPATADDFENEALTEVASKYIADGYELYTAESNASYYIGEGYMDEESGWGIAYLKNGFTGSYDDGNRYYSVEVYVVPEADITEVLGLKLIDEDDTTATYKEDSKSYCPKEGEYKYDKETEILVYEESFDYSEAVG